MTIKPIRLIKIYEYFGEFYRGGCLLSDLFLSISPCYRNKGYGSQILKLALVQAEKLGIKEAILTCNIDNNSSKKIIEKNNGKLLGIVFDEEENENLYRYSIITSQEKL